MNPVTPEISVIIPVHNGEKYLAEAIQSILDQNYESIEILVIDNASTDGTARIARKFATIRYFFLEEKGMANALNHGVHESRGALMSFLDADDMWSPNRLGLQLGAFGRHPEVDMIFGYVEQFISPELESPEKERLIIRTRELPGYFKGSMLIKKESFWRVGLFDKNSGNGDFIDWYMRAQEQNLQSVMLPDVLTMRRIHGNNLGYTNQNSRIEYVRVLKRALDRRRRQSKE
jgi:glycosyltransferase involved in cell wall biosynthesis